MTAVKDTKAPDPSNSTVFEAERYMVELADDLCDWMRERGAPARLALGAVLTAAGKIIGGVFSESEKDLARECGAADYFIRAEAEQAFEAWKSKSSH